jgi:hypothetical protein
LKVSTNGIKVRICDSCYFMAKVSFSFSLLHEIFPINLSFHFQFFSKFSACSLLPLCSNFFRFFNKN